MIYNGGKLIVFSVIKTLCEIKMPGETSLVDINNKRKSTKINQSIWWF